MSSDDDWLDIDLPTPKIEEGTPAEPTLPALPVGPQALVAAVTAQERRARFVSAWEGLTDKQRVFLNTWRECRFNANKAFRILANTNHHTSKTAVSNWLGDSSFELVRNTLRDASVEEILSRSNLVARQDDIVETLMTPTPILYQGQHTGFEEVQASQASRANETLMKAAGLLKDKEIEVNVGVVIGPPTLNIQVMPKAPSKTVVLDNVPIDAKFTEVPADDEWLNT